MVLNCMLSTNEPRWNMLALTGSCLEYNAPLPWTKSSVSALMNSLFSFSTGCDFQSSQAASKLKHTVSGVAGTDEVKNPFPIVSKLTNALQALWNNRFNGPQYSIEEGKY